MSPRRAGVKPVNPYANIRPSVLTKQLVSGLGDDDVRQERRYPSPSNAEYCSRRIAYMASDIPASSPRPPETMLAAEQGKAEEPIAERLLERAGFTIVGRQVTVSGELIGCPDGGTADLVLSKDNIFYVEDTKRLGLFRYLGLVKEGVKLAHPEYYTQLQLYMKGLGIENALLLAMSADYSAIKWYWRMRRYSLDSLPPPVWAQEFPADPAWQDSRIKRNEQIVRWIDKFDPNDVPRDHNPFTDRWPCDYCSHQGPCKTAGE